MIAMAVNPCKGGATMIIKKVINPDRLRHIEGGFSFIPHRFISDGFLCSLNQKELLLYFLLCLVSDRNGLSFYSYDAICSLLQLSLDEYLEARDSLIKKDLIAFEGALFQVLDLPESPVKAPKTADKRLPDQFGKSSRLARLIQKSLREDEGD
jgi:hypothetical protein